MAILWFMKIELSLESDLNKIDSTIQLHKVLMEKSKVMISQT